MHDQDPTKESAKRTLSEISHLFLSEVRERHTGGAPPPQRIPPVPSDAGHWLLLSTRDHHGVARSYRAVKGLCDLVGAQRPRLSISLLDPSNESEVSRVFNKLSGVCEQFLDWRPEAEPAVRP